MTYDQWKTRTPWDDAEEECRIDELLDKENAFDTALSRDEVAPGYHVYGPYVVQVLENSEIDYCSTIVMPARVGWTPRF